jgi:sensor histidine kinase YesM
MRLRNRSLIPLARIADFLLFSPTDMNNILPLSPFWKKQAKDILIIFLVSVPFLFITCSTCLTDFDTFIIILPVNFAFWLILWKGNALTSNLIDKLYNWIDQPLQRLIGGIVGHTAYTTLAVFCIFHLFELFGIQMGRIEYTLTISIGVTFVITLVLQSVSFLQSWREMAVKSERMNKDVAVAKYEALKNQVNPHFLFNSLNALSNLVYEDADQANQFITKLSQVYRYVLESKDKDLVELETEMKFIHSYLFLQKIRFGDSLQITENVKPAHSYFIPPLSIQMLLENSIKHNIVSREDPLEVRIFLENDYLVVENTLQKKTIPKSELSNIGLSNIQARYSFFTDKPVIIKDSDGIFSVSLPLLEK